MIIANKVLIVLLISIHIDRGCRLQHNPIDQNTRSTLLNARKIHKPPAVFLETTEGNH